MKRLCVRHLGSLKHGEVQFGNLTLVVIGTARFRATAAWAILALAPR